MKSLNHNNTLLSTVVHPNCSAIGIHKKKKKGQKKKQDVSLHSEHIHGGLREAIRHLNLI